MSVLVPYEKNRRGFSMLELSVTLFLMTVLGMLTWSVSQSVRSNPSAAAGLLAAAQIEGRRVVVDGFFPQDVAAQIVAASGQGLTIVTRTASGANEVSVHRLGDKELVLATPTGDHCLVLVDRIGGASTWARVQDAADFCAAGALTPNVANCAHEGNPKNPQVVTMCAPQAAGS